MNCQSFRYGCCGCCINMRWSQRRILRYLEENTRAAVRIFPESGRPGFWGLVKMHWARGGFWDHLLMMVLVMPTFGLSALVWRLVMGSCCFAGYIDEESSRAGCLIHPERVGGQRRKGAKAQKRNRGDDLRVHAFPLVPTLGCNRNLRCPMLDNDTADLPEDLVRISREGWKSLV